MHTGQKRSLNQMSEQKKSGNTSSDIPTTTQTTSTKKTRRSQTKYPGLNPGVNGRFRKDAIDFDYLDKLSPEEKDWLNRFMEEYNGTNFAHPGELLHKDKEEQRKLYGKNNASRRDLVNHQKAKGLLVDIDKHIAEVEAPGNLNQEDVLIAAIDEFNDGKTSEE